MDEQRRYLRPFGTKFGELEFTRMKTLQGEMLQQRIIQERREAVNYDILTEVHRTSSNNLTHIEP